MIVILAFTVALKGCGLCHITVTTGNSQGGHNNQGIGQDGRRRRRLTCQSYVMKCVTFSKKLQTYYTCYYRFLKFGHFDFLFVLF